MAVTAYRESSMSCGVSVDNPRELCVASTGETPPAPTAYWKLVDGEPLFLLAGHECVTPVSERPDWPECEPGDGPLACSCLCNHGICSGDDDSAVFDACAGPSPCPDASVGNDGPFDPALQCLIEALRERTPGLYEVRSGVDNGIEGRLLVRPDGAVQLLVQTYGTFPCFDALLWQWRPARNCALQPSAFFEACLADHGIQGCNGGDLINVLPAWFTACFYEPMECPF
jgi:hypothetical protein